MRKIQLLTALCAVFVVGCSPKVDTRGYVKDAQWKEKIMLGTTTQDEVLTNFGSPSARSTFGSDSWYYITSRKEAYAFLKPEIVEQEVVRIDFDERGIVSQVETFDKNQSKDFELAKRVTPTEGHALGFFEQILGNIGRFNKPTDDSAAPGRRPDSTY